MQMVKYVRHDTAGFVLFSAVAALSHAEVAAGLLSQRPGRIVSAGFVAWRDGRAMCVGESTSLGIASAEGDSVALAAQMGWPVAQRASA